jgi:hypothetical protein
LSLVRLFPTLGQLIIRKLGDTGGPPSDRVSQELDNIITWAKLSPRCIHRNFATTNSAGAGPDVLHTFTVPAGTLVANDFLDVWYAGNTATNDNDKAVQAQFDSQTYENGGLFDYDVGVGWAMTVRIGVIDLTHVIVSHILVLNLAQAGGTVNTFSSGNAGALIISRNTPLTVANLSSNAVVMRVRSLGVAAADVFQNTSIINHTSS